MSPPLLPSFPPLLGYLPREHLASGGQSSVYRALNPSTEHLAALKVVPLVISPSAQDAAAVQAKAKQLVREMRIHETLKHRNILRLFGGETREECEVEVGGRGRRVGWPAGLYMLLDLADGGDLFDKITPDVGVSEDIAHLYFKQLISGLKYLNHHGICHRDVKPENCLLDGHGNLLLSDFGLATVFKYKSQIRLLKDRCGSPPYAAPELARAQAYEAEPVDVWSAGVLLFALLFGNTPWDEPTPNSPEFAAYLSSRPRPSSTTNPSALLPLPPFEPWTRLSPDSGAAQLLLKMLTVDPKERIRLAGVEREGWYRQPNPFLDPTTGLVPPSESHLLLQRLLATLHGQGYIGAPEPVYEDLMDIPSEPSQPPSATQAALSQKLSQRGLDPQQSFRSSLQLYSRLSMAPTQRTNPNLTRFFTTQPLPVLLSLLSRALDSLSLPAPPSSPKGKAHELLYSSPSSGGPASGAPSVEEVQQAPLGTLLARFRIRSTDKRHQRLWVGVHISKSFLPTSPSLSSYSASQGMDVDSDSDEEGGPPAGGGGGGQEEKGEEGFDVVCLKRDADPLEMKRLWRELVRRMPEGVVVAT